MNSYRAAQLAAHVAGVAPIWEAQLLEDAEAGSILASYDTGETWRVLRYIKDMAGMSCGAVALQSGCAEETIRMTSKGTVQLAPPPPLVVSPWCEELVARGLAWNAYILANGPQYLRRTGH